MCGNNWIKSWQTIQEYRVYQSLLFLLRVNIQYFTSISVIFWMAQHCVAHLMSWLHTDGDFGELWLAFVVTTQNWTAEVAKLLAWGEWGELYPTLGGRMDWTNDTWLFHVELSGSLPSDNIHLTRIVWFVLSTYENYGSSLTSEWTEASCSTRISTLM